jgi:hypothetical protein
VHTVCWIDVNVLVYQLQASSCVYLYQALLNEPRANAAGAKALGEEEVWGIHNVKMGSNDKTAKKTMRANTLKNTETISFCLV